MQVDLLLIGAAHGAAACLADDRDNRDVIELRVVETVQGMDGTGPGRRRDHAHTPRELCVRSGLECRELLMPGLDEPWLVLGPLPGGEQAVDAVPGVPEDGVDAPLAQPCKQMVGDGLPHDTSWLVDLVLLMDADGSVLRARPSVDCVSCETSGLPQGQRAEGWLGFEPGAQSQPAEIRTLRRRNDAPSLRLLPGAGAGKRPAQAGGGGPPV